MNDNSEGDGGCLPKTIGAAIVGGLVWLLKALWTAIAAGAMMFAHGCAERLANMHWSHPEPAVWHPEPRSEPEPRPAPIPEFVTVPPAPSVDEPPHVLGSETPAEPRESFWHAAQEHGEEVLEKGVEIAKDKTKDALLDWLKEERATVGDYQARVNNSCDRAVTLAIAYVDPQGNWTTMGWWGIPGSSSRVITFTGRGKLTTYFYYYAETGDHLTYWGGDDASFRLDGGRTLNMTRREASLVAGEEFALSCMEQ
jgi:hypothetical protein